MVQLWYMAECPEDKHQENRLSPNVPVTLEELADLGVETFSFDPLTMSSLPKPDDPPSDVNRSMLDTYIAKRRYATRDEVKCGEATDEKLTQFFEEHCHEDDEVRLIKEGSGYFDVRDAQERWIRVKVVAGDLILLPAGIYHRFTLTEEKCATAIRIFSTAAKWVPIPRVAENDTTNAARVKYVASFLSAEKPRKGTSIGRTENDTDNILITHPTKFDATIRSIMDSKEMLRTDKDVLFLYFSGVRDSRTGKSWCPNCVDADPIVEQCANHAKELLAPTGGRVIFVESIVQRGSYKGVPDYLYRKHPFVQLQCIPTLIVVERIATVDESDDEQGGSSAKDGGIRVLHKFEGTIPTAWVADLRPRAAKV